MRILILILLFTIGCESKTDIEIPTTGTGNPYIIEDKVFINYTSDMYFNPEDYEGMEIQIEGIIYVDYYFNEAGDFYIIRNTPGCCGNDGLAGLEIYYENGYPEENTWVTGKGYYQQDDDGHWILKLYSLEETEEGDIFLDYSF